MENDRPRFVPSAPLHSAYVNVLTLPVDGKWTGRAMTTDRELVYFDMEMEWDGVHNSLALSNLRDCDGYRVADLDIRLAVELRNALTEWKKFHAAGIIGRIGALSMNGAYDTVGGIGYVEDTETVPVPLAA